MPDAQDRALTDNELLAASKDPRADLTLLTREERQRLRTLDPSKTGQYIGPQDVYHGPWWNPIYVPQEGDPSANRVDRNVFTVGSFGVEPEVLVGAGLPVANAVRGASGMAGRAVAGAKAIGSQVAPQLKYEAIKSTLEAVGVPGSVAVPIALGLSGLRRGGQAEPAAAPRTRGRGTRATPSAAPPETPTVASPPGSPAPAAPAVTLTAKEQEALQALTKEGYAEADVMQAIQRARAQAPPAASPAAPTSFPRGIQTEAELREFERLVQAGKSRAEALQAVAASRGLAQRLGATPERAKQAIDFRNEHGYWQDEK